MSHSGELMVALGRTPGGPLVLIGESSATLPDAAWIPEGKLLTDAVTTSSGVYVLLYEPASLTANVYQKRGSSLTQVTSSETMKYSLEADREIDRLAYVSTVLESEAALANIVAAEIVLLEGGVETSVSQGLDLVGFSGGELGIKTRDGVLAYKDGVARGPVYEGDMPVSATDGKRFVAYNALSRAIDTYDSSGGFSDLRYESSMPVDYVPTALGFHKGELIAAGVSSAETFFVVTPDTRITLPRSAPATSGVPFSFASLSL